MSVYSPHTALDSVHGGINDWLAQCAGVPENSTLSDHSFDVSLLGEPKGDEGGVGRLLSLQDPVSIEELVGRIKKHLHVEYGERTNFLSFDDVVNVVIDRSFMPRLQCSCLNSDADLHVPR